MNEPHRRRSSRAALPLLLGVSLFVVSISAYGQDALASLKARVNHIVVIYQENWSFDGLYGHFPGANGVADASSTTLAQVDKAGARLTAAPSPMNGKNADAH